MALRLPEAANAGRPPKSATGSPLRAGSQILQDILDLPHCEVAAQPRRNNIVGSAFFIAIGHLQSADRVDSFVGHSRAFEQSLGLNTRRRRDDRHCITHFISAGFEQQRYVQNHKHFSSPGRRIQKPSLIDLHKRMKNVFQAPQCGPVAKNALCDGFVINGAVSLGARKSRFDRGYRRASRGKHMVNRVIGVVDRNAQPSKLIRGGAFSHGDTPG
jgi:hypothetical protein